jgi:hypothetical protein
MTLEIIGALTLLAGLGCMIIGQTFATYAFLISTLLGSAAATVLTALGGASIPPAHLLLLFMSLELVLRPASLWTGLSSIAQAREGFWLLLTVAYGVFSAFVMPRLFAGSVDLFIIGHTASGAQSFIAAPLGPVSGNMTQSIYLIGDLVCFIIFYAYGSSAKGLKTIALAAITCSVVNVAFAMLDLMTYWTGTAYVFDFIRNASYRMLDDVEIAGLKRIVGSFAEASAFAFATLGLLAFNLTLWLRGVYTWWTGPAALASVVCLLFTTSTTGYAGFAVLICTFVAFALFQVMIGRATRPMMFFLAFLPAVVLVAGIVVATSAPLRTTVEKLFETTIAEKFASQSGVERSSWNRQAIAAFPATFGFGAGLGSVRSSSWIVAVPSSLGAFGSLTLGIFVVMLLLGGRRTANSDRSLPSRHQAPLTADHHDAIKWACRSACFASIVGASIAGSFVDLGLPFFLFAGAACGRPRPLSPRVVPARPPLRAALYGPSPAPTGQRLPWSPIRSDRIGMEL